MSDFKFPGYNVNVNSGLDSINEGARRQVERYAEIGQQIADNKRKERETLEAMSESLKGIRENTAHLNEIMFLVREGNIARDETYYLLVELLKITTANNIEEAEGIFRTVIEKAIQLKANIELITFFSTQGKLMIETLKELLKVAP